MNPVLETNTKPKQRVGDGTPGPGRPKGLRDKRTIGAEKAAQALVSHAWDVVRELLDNKKEPRIRFEAARIVIAYACGLPTQRVEIEARQVASEFAAMAGVSAEELLSRTVQFVEGKVN